MKLEKINGALYDIGQLLNRFYLRRLNLTVDDSRAPLLDKPYIILANHSSVMDYRVTSFLLRKHKPYHVAAKNQFAGRRRLMLKIGALPKVQFQPSVTLIKQIQAAVQGGKSVVIFPEGVVSFDGVNRDLPFSVAKLIKFLGVGVAVIKIKGTYLVKPRFDEVFHKTDRVEAEFFESISADDVKGKTTAQIYDKIKSDLYFDVWEWSRRLNVGTSRGNTAKGIDNLLYRCVNCGGHAFVRGDALVCGDCGAVWKVDRFYRLIGDKTLDIHQWFETQRQSVAAQVRDGVFALDDEFVTVRVLDGYKGFREVGEGRYSQNRDGVTFEGVIDGKNKKLFFDGARYPSAPVGNDFIEFTSRYVTYRFYFTSKGAAIRSAVGVEEVYKQKHKK